MSTDQYASFLHASVAALSTTGAQPLALPEPGPKPPWALGWSQILLADGPGPSILYAFTHTDGDPIAVRARIDHLVRGVSALVRPSGAPMEVVAVVACTGPVDDGTLRALARLSPSQYFPGVRPSVWAVDLTAGRVDAGRRLNTPDGLQVLRMMLRGAPIRPGDPGRPSAAYALLHGTTPWFTYLLIAVNVLIYALLTLSGGPANDAVLRAFGALDPRLIQNGQWWRLLTAMFLHASVAHILFNMLSLYAVGTLAERLYGHARFLLIYFVSGLIGSLVSFSFSELTGIVNVLGVGASGAIFGVAGALVAVRFHRASVFPPGLRRQVSTSMVPLVLVSLVIAYLTPYVDNSAHVGGLLGGALLGARLPLSVPGRARRAPASPDLI